MEKSIEQIISEKLVVISEALEVEVKFSADEKDENRVAPAFNMSAMASKWLALLVYSGINIQTNLLSPAYNCVHADVEFWKKYMEDKKKESESDPESASVPEPSGGDSGVANQPE